MATYSPRWTLPTIPRWYKKFHGIWFATSVVGGAVAGGVVGPFMSSLGQYEDKLMGYSIQEESLLQRVAIGTLTGTLLGFGIGAPGPFGFVMMAGVHWWNKK